MPSPTLVLVHGALNDHTVWAPLVPGLERHGWRVLAVDLPAHAGGGAPLSSVEAMADWLLAELDAQGIERAALAGHSMGSLVALEAAARAPARVTHLALLGSTFPMKVSGALLKTALEDEPAAIEMVARWSHAPGPDGAEHPATQGSRALMRAVAARGPHLLHTDLAACKAYANGAAAAALVRCPVLFLAGARDMMTPPDGGQLPAALASPRQVTVDAGHQMMAEQPAAVLDALTGFLAAR
ncbi:alpha/beta fold hydrolase [Pseudoduganella armeniaca]|uniref:Alpha/beta hydrolase n=1 Tax=Pseudoduganella armeniaca TaxID=2072590 RepID=A0A2R4CB24_9BURK|nr:alpha/beta hydrolase [Pseudoduganella armeniaca]AVR96762.1 alpha/beta hydrolase [Pseudoduganella armeniaca]